MLSTQTHTNTPKALTSLDELTSHFDDLVEADGKSTPVSETQEQVSAPTAPAALPPPLALSFEACVQVTDKAYLQHLATLLALASDCQVNFYQVRKTRAQRVAVSDPSMATAKPIQRIEERLAAEAALLQKWLSPIELRVGENLSAIAQELAQSTHTTLFVAVPFEMSSRDETIVCLLSAKAGADPQTFCDTIRSFAQQQSLLNQLVYAWNECQLASLWRGRVSLLNKLTQSRYVILSAVALSIVLCIPAPYLPVRECTLEPASRHHITAPSDGILQEAYVRPGESVTTGQLLAKLDDKQLQRDLAIAKAEFESASKRREVALAQRSGGELRIAQLEQQQAELTIQSVQAKLTRTEIRSPVDGLLVQGDWLTNLGKPLKLGDPLFEVCEPDNYLAKVELQSDDLDHILPGCAVRLCTGGFLDQVTGTITRIEPKGQVVDNRCVFYADVALTSQHESLRPGLKISAKLKPQWQSIGWQMFRHPYRWLANWWIW